MLVQTLSQQHESLLGAYAAALDQQEIVSHHTVVGESSQGGYVLFSKIGLSGGIVLGSGPFALSNSIDLLVNLGSVEVTFLTGSGD